MKQLTLFADPEEITTAKPIKQKSLTTQALVDALLYLSDVRATYGPESRFPVVTDLAYATKRRDKLTTELAVATTYLSKLDYSNRDRFTVEEAMYTAWARLRMLKLFIENPGKQILVRWHDGKMVHVLNTGKPEPLCLDGGGGWAETPEQHKTWVKVASLTPDLMMCDGCDSLKDI
jgi:hypothetical protein